VVPPKSGGLAPFDGKLAAVLYAVVNSFCAAPAKPLAILIDPVTVPGGNPVIEEPGETPRFPRIVVAPLFVTVEAPRTPKVLTFGPSDT